MDTWRISSCLTGQSMATKDICILVVHNDPMYRNIMVEMLENCSHYEVKRYEMVASALNIIEGKKEGLNIIITDIHRSHSNGFEIINYIEKEFKLPVISMIPRQNARVVPVGPDSDATLYFVKSLSVTEFKTHWQHAYTEEKGKTSFQSVSVVQEGEAGTSLQIYSSVHEVIRKDQNDKKRKVEEADDQSEEDKYDISNGKKPRVIWNEELHHKFVKAVELLGLDSAVPKKILEIMKVPALTRENIASHLQKYRISLKCAKEEMQSTSSIYGINSTPVRYFQSKHSGFISSQPNHQRYHTQNPLLRSYQPRSSPFNVPNFSSLETSNSTSNLGKQQLSYAHNSFLVSNTQSIMRPINTNMPLSNLFSSYPEASTTTSNLGQQNFVTVNNNHVSLMFPNTHNSHVIDTTQIHSSPLPNENPQPNSLNNTRYVGLGVTTNGELADCYQTRTPNINADTEDNRTSFHEGNGNERLVQFLSTELDNNAEQQLYVPPAAEIDIEDLLNEIDGITIPDFDIGDMLM